MRIYTASITPREPGTYAIYGLPANEALKDRLYLHVQVEHPLGVEGLHEGGASEARQTGLHGARQRRTGQYKRPHGRVAQMKGVCDGAAEHAGTGAREVGEDGREHPVQHEVHGRGRGAQRALPLRRNYEVLQPRGQVERDALQAGGQPRVGAPSPGPVHLGLREHCATESTRDLLGDQALAHLTSS